METKKVILQNLKAGLEYTIEIVSPAIVDVYTKRDGRNVWINSFRSFKEARESLNDVLA